MQVKEEDSDRRRKERRRDDKERRHDGRSCNPRRSNPRRSNVRLDRSFEVSVLDYNGKTVNVSASGVYLEVEIDEMDLFSPGAIIPLQIKAVTKTSEDRERKFKLNGMGTVIRNCIIENPDHANVLGVALEFTEKLNTELDND
ncbi:MAG: hypothetical protein GY775_00480 [Candidatus Scalindua sp.]|nr:hypothetical protein [Candidatus Scalindua sp.]